MTRRAALWPTSQCAASHPRLCPFLRPPCVTHTVVCRYDSQPTLFRSSYRLDMPSIIAQQRGSSGFSRSSKRTLTSRFSPTTSASNRSFSSRIDLNATREMLSNAKSNVNFKHDKIIFLDVDGVLHSIFARTEEQLFRTDCVQRLKRLVDETGAKVCRLA